jgi:hypothetical protein
MSDKQHLEDTLYSQWSDGMYVMLDDLDGDYELALVENSLRDSAYASTETYFYVGRDEDCIGVQDGDSGVWWSQDCHLKLTRAQALYIATGDVSI